MKVEHEQLKPKKLKVETCEKSAENESCETVLQIPEHDKTEKKKKKKKKRLSGTSENGIGLNSNSLVSELAKAAVPQNEIFEKKQISGNNSPMKKGNCETTLNTPKKKTKKNQNTVENNLPLKSESQEIILPGNNVPKKKKKNKKKNKKKTLTGTKIVTPAKNPKKKSTTVRGLDISDDRLKAYGIRNPKKFKNAIIFKPLQAQP